MTSPLHSIALYPTPRSTWLHCSDDHDEAAVVRLLDDLDVPHEPGRIRQNPVPHCVVVEVGYETGRALDALAERGFTFEWHHNVDPRNREPACAGVPVDGYYAYERDGRYHLPAGDVDGACAPGDGDIKSMSSPWRIPTDLRCNAAPCAALWAGIAVPG